MADIWNGLNRARIDVVARYAVQNRTFRMAAKVPTSTQDRIVQEQALQDELTKGATPPGALDDLEMSFIIGWADLCHNEFGADDARLIDAINRELLKSGPTG